ncbi:NADPH-dependent 7-cyano-7-deazaguanine reductase QueF [Litorilituus lipolyticus]|uniref:NADPH-dependent 7-cyano-7-deazaguanine reductase n=1 Tax=Litorilituus lipolyticus TaxID=2491017 RepID=A0A502KLQ6_9GAMM|nr:NADPH-dependent 7-cyano-7-deazaguanine reductase QueF [Litorilituus lipolyticus]TPH12548.1 NADPH-dependent 7-cyano-7-deazaguanine reductase QueF [Litorilituus lipolyticus]
MTPYQNASQLKELTLGKKTDYTSEYDPKLLQAVPRSLNRDDLALNEANLPFIGEDVWYGYELSWLNNKGKPVVALVEFRFACTSPNIVESKSFKLYLNSFNQTKFNDIEEVKSYLEKDLSATSGTKATVTLFPVDNCPALEIADEKAVCIDDLDISIEDYQFNAEHLLNSQSNHSQIKEHNIVSHLLKSNCLITNQPDWASIYIHYTGKEISQEQLLTYLISFRQHNEFHEQCVERIFCDLQQYCQLEALTVYARYTRRGGLDINPFRSTHVATAPWGRTLRQ